MSEQIQFDRQDRAVMAWMVGFSMAHGACRYIHRDALQQLLTHLGIDIELGDVDMSYEEVKVNEGNRKSPE